MYTEVPKAIPCDHYLRTWTVWLGYCCMIVIPHRVDHPRGSGGRLSLTWSQAPYKATTPTSPPDFFFFFFMIVTHREREREAKTQAEGEVGSMHREPDVGFDLGSPG